MTDFGRDKASIKNGMTINQVFDFLTGLGVTGYWLDENKIVMETCCHNHVGEGSHKMYYYDNTKLFYCYTGCGRFDIFELLSKMSFIEKGEELTLDDAITLYTSSQSFMKLGKNTFTQEDSLDIEYVKPDMQIFPKKDYTTLPRVIVNDWVREGISPRTQRKYNIRFNYHLGSITFPHLDSDFNLVAIRQRIINEELVSRLGKYRPLERRGVQYSAPSSFYLFGVPYNRFNIRREKKAIVYEGEQHRPISSFH